MHEAKLIRLLYADDLSVKKMQKPDKILMENTNLLQALSLAEPNVGTMRETFFCNQLGYFLSYSIYQRSFASFLVRGGTIVFYYDHLAQQPQQKSGTFGLCSAFTFLQIKSGTAILLFRTSGSGIAFNPNNNTEAHAVCICMRIRASVIHTNGHLVSQCFGLVMNLPDSMCQNKALKTPFFNMSAFLPPD